MSIYKLFAFAVLISALGSTAAAQGDLEKLTVPEDRGKPDSRTIELAFARLKTTSKTPGSPIVYLDGGPGGSGIGLYRVDEYKQLFDTLRAVGDVILLSQRGTGFSTPRLTCRDTSPVPTDLFASAQRMTDLLAPRGIKCADEWRAKGVDLSAYNTAASADDLEDLRKLLGAPKISVFGFSYGTHLALAAVRRHPSSIDRVILAGTEGPDHSQKLPHTFDLQLARLANLEASRPNAPQPGLVEVAKTLLAQLDKQPVIVDARPQGAKESVKLTIGKEGFQYLLRRDIGDTNDTANVIRLIRDTARGDYAMLAAFAGRRFAEFSGGMGLMGYAMDCGSGVSPQRRDQITRELPGSLLGVMTNYPFPQVCGALKLPALPDSFRAPIASTLPALFISGSLDSNTPPYQAEQVRWGFPNSVHVIVENAGHESTLTLPETRTLIVDFLRGVDVTGRRIVAPVPIK